MPTIPIRWADNTKELTARLKEGLNVIDATKAAAEKMTRTLSGDNLIRSANNYVAAVAQMGGATKLTGAEQARVNALLTKAIEKYTALGKTAPQAMIDLAAATKKVEQPTAGLTTKMIALGSAVGSFVGNLAADAFNRIVGGLTDIAANGIKLAPIVGSFNSLTKAVGESGDAMLRAARGSTKGLISDLDLMQAANKGLLLGLPITAQSFGLLAQTAVTLGKAMGQGPVKSFDDLITALGRSSPMILDNLGLSVKVGEANDKYAKSVGKTAEELTTAEQKLAFYNAAMDAAKLKVEEVGGLNLTLADRVQQAKVAFTNFTDALGVAIATSPVVNAAFGGIADSISKAFGENQTQQVQRLVGVVNDVAIGVIDVAQIAITGADLLYRAWSGITLLFDGLRSVIGLVALAFGKLVEGVLNVASYTPGVSAMFAGLAAKMRDFNAVTAASQKTFHDQAAASLEAVKGNGAFASSLASASTALTTMRGKMEQAAKTQVDSAKIADQLVKKHQELGDASVQAGQKSAMSAEKIRDANQKLLVAMGERNQKIIAESIKVIDAYAKAWLDFMKIYDKAKEAIQAPALSKSPFSGADILAQIGTNGAAGLENIGIRIEKPIIDHAQNAWEQAVSAFPQILQNALTGGGGFKGAFQAVTSMIGSSLGEGLFKAGGLLNGLGNKLSGVFGSAFGLALPGIGGALGALVGPAISKLYGALKRAFGGPSEAELGGRDLVAKFETDLGGFDNAVNRVGDAYAAIGKTREQAAADFKAMLDAEKQGPAAVQAWIDKFRQAMEEAARLREKDKASADQLEAEIKAQSAARMKSAETELQGLLEQRNALYRGIEAEAPEANMGVIEAQQRSQLAVLDEQIQHKANAYAELARETGQQMADAIVEALRAIRIEPIHVPVNVELPENPYRHDWERPEVEQPEVSTAARGGRVTRHGVQYFAAGGSVLRMPQWKPVGTDVVPAMLSPGEMVLNASQQSLVGSLLAQGRSAASATGGGTTSVQFGDIRIEATGADLNDMTQFAERFNEGVRRNTGGMLDAVKEAARRVVVGG